MAKLRILFAEDSRPDVELISNMLTIAGYDLELTVVDQDEAFLEALDQRSYDLILSDHSMPSFSGLMALHIAHTKSPDTPFIFVSGTLGEELAIECLKSGATDYVLKDRLARLVPVVRRALEEAAARRKQKETEETLREEATSRMAILESLHQIDIAIGSSMNLALTANVLLDKVVDHLGIDAADILVIDRHSPALEDFARRGFRSTVPRWRLPFDTTLLDEILAGGARVTRLDLRDQMERFHRTALVAEEGFVCYAAVPIVSKGRLRGMIETFCRHPLNPDAEWEQFLAMAAGQAAIAMDNAELFEGLERSNMELLLAYDATIEGWSRAMDLRDKETEGHTRRVTETTIALSRTIGTSEEEIVHIRRGALLHDIGKMGVPDHILLKEGPLTDEEWAIMRKHPDYALQMLSPISFLEPALDIPYCHHEKWDGSGYPRGLKGEKIPAAARVFAIVDVWDALRSDRPYRPAWTHERVVDYIRALAGTHFDPHAVGPFLELIGSGDFPRDSAGLGT